MCGVKSSVRAKAKETKIDLIGLKNRLVARLLQRSSWLFKRWAQQADVVQNLDSPWTPCVKAIHLARVALVTTAGIHLRTQPPFDMFNPHGDPSFREIPASTTSENLVITHNYYDHRDADVDVNVVFPLERLLELAQKNEIGAVNHRHFSFMGHTTGDQLEILMQQAVPAVAEALKTDGVDLVVLTPT